jgi:hypothetical protein
MRKVIYVSEAVKGFPVDLAGEQVKIPNNTKKFLNGKLADLCRIYYKGIPLDELFNLLRGSYIEPIQEDGDIWSGFLTGAEGRTTFELAMLDNNSGEYKPVKDCVLSLSWYKMPSGKFEIVAYLS